MPLGTIEKYKATTGWNDFYNIEEGVNGVDKIRSLPVSVKIVGDMVLVEGAAEGTPVKVYLADGHEIGRAVSCGGLAKVTTDQIHGRAVIVKIADRTLKVGAK